MADVSVAGRWENPPIASSAIRPPSTGTPPQQHTPRDSSLSPPTPRTNEKQQAKKKSPKRPRRPFSAPIGVPDMSAEAVMQMSEKKLKEQQDEISAIKSKLAKLERIEERNREREQQAIAKQMAMTESATQTKTALGNKNFVPKPPNTAASPLNQGLVPRGVAPASGQHWTRALLNVFHCTMLPNKRRACPLPVESPTLVRADQKYLLLHGGTNGTHITNETWLFDISLEQWRKPKPIGDIPLGRYGHTAVAYKRRMVIFGGFGLSGIPTPGTTGMNQYTATEDTFQPVGISSAMVGLTSQWVDSDNGYKPISCGLLNSVYSFDFDTHQWQELPHGPEQVYVKNHTAVVHQHFMYVFGGCTVQGRTNAVKVYDLDVYRWLPDEYFNAQLYHYTTHNINISTDLPEPRSGHTAVVHKNLNGKPCMVIFGGRLSKFSYCNSVYMYNFESRIWTQIPCNGAVPHERAGHTSVVYKNHMVVFGGYFNQSKEKKVYFNDIHVLNLETWTWQKMGVSGQALPYNRCGHVAALFEATNRQVKMLVFGGWGEASMPMDPYGQPAASLEDAQVYSPNNDTFTFAVAAPYIKPKPIRNNKQMMSSSMPAGRVSMSGGADKSTMATSMAAAPPIVPITQAALGAAPPPSAGTDPAMPKPPKERRRRDNKGPPKPWVRAATKFTIPALPPPKRTPLANPRLPSKAIEESVLRLSNTDRIARAREKLENKFLTEQEKWQLTYEEQNDFIERLYYAPMEAKDQREKELEQKYLKREDNRVLDEDEVYDMVERLTHVPTPKEDPPPKPHTISQPTINAMVDRMYTKARENQIHRVEALRKKYYTELPTKKKSPMELENLIAKLYNEPHGVAPLRPHPPPSASAPKTT
eukprot:TRINITY_DN67954_c1_g1_i1.p1 TRINITY_DN67954_c1_g1~~TRINITY_DN67954_c1_g1_i1.p1  ORF type:complete len:872 (-),score=92.49 TRINITY_DN67954_c1_g1_i1:163-2778(-)